MQQAIRRLAERMNDAIGHPVAFVIAFIQTLLWTILVLTTGLDPHGFWFLYLATAVSYVTQFTLTLVALAGKREAAHAARHSEQALTSQLATMRAMHELMQIVRDEQAEVLEQLEELDEHLHDDNDPLV